MLAVKILVGLMMGWSVGSVLTVIALTVYIVFRGLDVDDAWNALSPLGQFLWHVLVAPLRFIDNVLGLLGGKE